MYSTKRPKHHYKLSVITTYDHVRWKIITWISPSPNCNRYMVSTTWCQIVCGAVLVFSCVVDWLCKRRDERKHLHYGHGFACNCSYWFASPRRRRHCNFVVVVVVVVDAVAFHCIALLTFTLDSFIPPLLLFLSYRPPKCWQRTRSCISSTYHELLFPLVLVFNLQMRLVAAFVRMFACDCIAQDDDAVVILLLLL